jgi:hypothetical protein
MNLINNINVNKLEDCVKNYNWDLIHHTENEILFEKTFPPSQEILKIKRMGDRLLISLPLRNSGYQFKTYMKSTEKLYEYIELHICDK